MLYSPEKRAVAESTRQITCPRVDPVTDTAALTVKRQIAVRPIHDAEEAKFRVDLEQRVWGFSPIDTVPDQIFIVAYEEKIQASFRERLSDYFEKGFWRCRLSMQ